MSLMLFRQVRTQQDGRQRRTQPGTESASTLNLDAPASRNVSNNSLVYANQSGYFVMVVLGDYTGLQQSSIINIDFDAYMVISIGMVSLKGSKTLKIQDCRGSIYRKLVHYFCDFYTNLKIVSNKKVTSYIMFYLLSFVAQQRSRRKEKLKVAFY